MNFNNLNSYIRNSNVSMYKPTRLVTGKTKQDRNLSMVQARKTEILKENSDLEDCEDTGVSNDIDKKLLGFDPERYKITEEDRINQKVSVIAEKLKSGIELTAGEMSFIEEHAPLIYKMAVEAKKVREQFLKDLQNCNSKKEVSELKLSNDIGCLSRMKAAKKAQNQTEVMKQITFKNTTQNEYDKFINTKEYKELPEEDDEKNLSIKILAD